MKVDAFYDVLCDVCGRSMSHDYACGLCDSAETAVKEARRVGFHMIGGKRVCPVCAQSIYVRRIAEEPNGSLMPSDCRQ